MAATSTMVPIGTAVPDFTLPDLTGVLLTRQQLQGPGALLVAFVCNHCPYVRHVEQTLGRVLDQAPNLAAGGICSNDIAAHPDDAPDRLREQASRAGWSFPYLVDATQQVARAFGAACTPDFFLYGADGRLAYRGAFDDSTPGNARPVTGALLADAIRRVLAGEPVPEPHRPSMGCSIKWRSDTTAGSWFPHVPLSSA